MLIFQLPRRQIQIEKDISEVPRPYNVSLKVKLGPEEYFGDAPLTGKMREITGGQSVQMRYPTFHGLPKPLPMTGEFANKFAYQGTLSGIPISFDGGTCTLEFNVEDFNALHQFIQELAERLAASFSPACVVPVEIISVSGTVSGVPFTVGLPTSSWRPQMGASGAVPKQLNTALPHLRQTPRQIISAQRYLTQNYRMDYQTEFASQVTGERLLNLCKAFESLVPASVFSGDPNKQDDRIRKFLGSWGVHTTYIDVLISLRKLRSSLDIAHTRRAPISTEAHESIDDFIPLAEACVRALVNLTLEKFSVDPSIYPEERNEIEDIAALRFIRKYTGLPLPSDIRTLLIANPRQEGGS